MKAFEVGHILDQGRWYEPGQDPGRTPGQPQAEEASGAREQEQPRMGRAETTVSTSPQTSPLPRQTEVR
jgi:hypothetical protein